MLSLSAFEIYTCHLHLGFLWEWLKAVDENNLTNIELLSQVLTMVRDLIGVVAIFVAALWAYTKFILENNLLPSIQLDVICNQLGYQGNKLILEFVVTLNNLGNTTLIAKNIRIDIRYLLSNEANPELFQDPYKQGRLRFPYSLRRHDLKQLSDADQRHWVEYLPDYLPEEELLYRWERLTQEQRAKIASNQDSDVHERYQTTARKYHQAMRHYKEKKNRPKIRQQKKQRQRGVETRGFPILEYDTFVRPGVTQNYGFVTALPVNTSCILAWASFEYVQNLSCLQAAILRLSRLLGLTQWTLMRISKPHTAERAFAVQESDQKIWQ
jgi:hypothetical protein